ncbi:MAG: hypothetical protein CM15mP104_0540 [Gammaproteobacteria bacterium]|nr:MAG: hypothetical protein CM15mP104_0540 [Gammaproteobacteria bacterium]
MHGKNAYVYGFGNHLAQSKNYNHKLLIIYPNLYLSTAMMFDEFDKANINKRNLKMTLCIFEKIILRFTLFSIMQMITMDLNFNVWNWFMFFTPWVRNESTKLFLEKIPKNGDSFS